MCVCKYVYNVCKGVNVCASLFVKVCIYMYVCVHVCMCTCLALLSTYTTDYERGRSRVEYCVEITTVS